MNHCQSLSFPRLIGELHHLCCSPGGQLALLPSKPVTTWQAMGNMWRIYIYILYYIYMYKKQIYIYIVILKPIADDFHVPLI